MSSADGSSEAKPGIWVVIVAPGLQFGFGGEVFFMVSWISRRWCLSRSSLDRVYILKICLANRVFGARSFSCSGVRASIVVIVIFDSGRNTVVCCMVFKEFNGSGGIYMSLMLDR
jgi:hypothetical protein